MSKTPTKCTATSYEYGCDRDGNESHMLHHDPEDGTWWIYHPDSAGYQIIADAMLPQIGGWEQCPDSP